MCCVVVLRIDPRCTTDKYTHVVVVAVVMCRYILCSAPGSVCAHAHDHKRDNGANAGCSLDEASESYKCASAHVSRFV